MNKTLVTTVPALLSFANDGSRKLIPGRGEAGWTVYSFENAREAASFVAAYGMCAMPCWKRFEIIDGELCQVR